MQRLFVLLGGIFVSCYCGFCANFSVTQTPSAVTLRKGEQVHLTCSWNTTISRVKVKWFKDNREMNQTSKRPETKNIKDCEILVLNNADRDVGFYICEVTIDIPVLRKVNGTGTNVTYYRNNDDNIPDSHLIPSKEDGDRPDSHLIPSKEDRDRPDSHSVPSTERAAEKVYEDGPVIFAIRCVPFITLLLAVCFLSRGGPKIRNNRPRAGISKEEEQALVIEEENDEKGQEEGEEKAGQRRKVRKKDKDLKQEGKLELVNELRGTEREVKEINQETEEEKEVKLRNEQMGRRKEVEKKEEQMGQERGVDQQMGQKGNVEKWNEHFQEREVERNDEQMG
ncbi:uncharacterized protein Hap1MRO34_012830 [Clarias gariepinus]